ncbi:MAG TPA: hypothetical protein VMV44_02600 [Rectinemataceae bacterium]|nr:hypothetical protein [Rectinemataceae bacterium]
MDLGFIKLRIAGSDLLLLEGIGDGRGRDRSALARSILHRRRGVGALRLAVISRAEKDLWLEVYDRKGSRDAALFDASLCAARWLLDSGRAESDSLRFRNGLGEILVDVLDGSSLGLSTGPLLGLPDREILDREGAGERRLHIESKGESFDALPVALRAQGGPAQFPASGSRVEAGLQDQGPEGVVFFHEGGQGPLRVRLSGSRNSARPPAAVPTRIISEGSIGIGTPRDAMVDTVSMAAMALGAASLFGRTAEEALVASGDGGLWVRRNSAGGLYVAARPSYVFRGDFPVEDEAS